jgi:hypothetical protein
MNATVRNSAVALVVIAFASCVTPQPQLAEKRLRHFYRAAETALYQQKTPRPMRVLPRLVREHLLPHAMLLHRRAHALLRRLPRASIPLTEFQPVREKQLNEVAGNWRAALKHFDAQMSPKDMAAMLFLTGWNPIKLAENVRSVAETRLLAAADYGKRHLIRVVAPPEVLLTKGEPDNPEIAFRGTMELFFVQLRYDAKLRAYAIAALRWYERK